MALKDFALKQLCPHYIVDEWLRVERDGRTLRPVKFPSNSKVQIKKNGVLIPKEGLFSGVTITSRNSTPFTITRGVNNEIRFSVNEGPIQKIQIPSGNEVSSRRIVQAINEQAEGVTAVLTNRRIMIETLESGKDVSLFLQGGNAHQTLGLPSMRFYHGHQIVPSWGIVHRRGMRQSGAKQIQFSEKLKTNDDIFEVSYYTRRQDCRRCQGLGVEDDLRHNGRGVPEFVRGINLLVQEVEKVTFTIKGSNIFYTWYGTSLIDLIGTKISNAGFITSQIVNEIGQALEKYRNVRVQQAKTQPVGDQEFLSRVTDIQVQQDNFDPTIFRINVEIQNRSNQVDQIQRVVTVNDLPDNVRRVQ